MGSLIVFVFIALIYTLSSLEWILLNIPFASVAAFFILAHFLARVEEGKFNKKDTAVIALIVIVYLTPVAVQRYMIYDYKFMRSRIESTLKSLDYTKGRIHVDDMPEYYISELGLQTVFTTEYMYRVLDKNLCKEFGKDPVEHEKIKWVEVRNGRQCIVELPSSEPPILTLHGTPKSKLRKVNDNYLFLPNKVKLITLNGESYSTYQGEITLLPLWPEEWFTRPINRRHRFEALAPEKLLLEAMKPYIPIKRVLETPYPEWFSDDEEISKRNSKWYR